MDRGADGVYLCVGTEEEASGRLSDACSFFLRVRLRDLPVPAVRIESENGG